MRCMDTTRSEGRGRTWQTSAAALIVVCALLTSAAECNPEQDDAAASSSMSNSKTTPSTATSAPVPAVGISVPLVVGMKLDKARDKLADVGLNDDPNVEDAIEDRTMVKASNWVVVSQDPAPGAMVKKGARLDLRIAKPDDEGFDDLLVSGGGQELAQQRERERIRKENNKRAEEAEDRDPCALFSGLSVDTRLFSADLQDSRKDVQDADDTGYKRVTVACANDDEGLVVHAITSRTPQEAVGEADVAADDKEGVFTSSAFAVERYPREDGGGGFWVNTELGSSRLSWSVGYWFIMVEAYFWDAVSADVRGISNAGEMVVKMFNELKAHATEVIDSGDW